VLCDVKLPDGNGVDTVKVIKEKYPTLEVILLTAYGNIPDGVQAIKNGALIISLKVMITTKLFRYYIERLRKLI
jgi:DNA-binding NtrC family response regulator